MALQAFHDDLTSRRKAVGDTIDRCNRLLRETTSDDADDIRFKLATIRDQADFVHRLSTDRLKALEDTLPVAQHFVATHADLRAWLDEIDAEIRSIDVVADSSPEQIRKQADSAKVNDTERSARRKTGIVMSTRMKVRLKSRWTNCCIAVKNIFCNVPKIILTLSGL